MLPRDTLPALPSLPRIKSDRREKQKGLGKQGEMNSGAAAGTAFCITRKSRMPHQATQRNKIKEDGSRSRLEGQTDVEAVAEGACTQELLQAFKEFKSGP